MPIYAFEDVDDALAATRAFLWPVDRTRWLKLALVVFFVGGAGANFNTAQFNVPANQGTPPGGVPSPPDVGASIVLLVGAVVAAALLVGLLVLFVGSVMEFVLVDSLRTETVEIRRYWSERWRQGLRLFGFRVLLGLFVLGIVAVLAALFLLPLVAGGGPGGLPGAGFSIVTLVVLLPVVVVLAVLVGLVSEFTTVFVVPIMVLGERTVLGGWRRLWSSLVSHPWQYLGYALVAFVLTLAAGVLVTILIGIAAVVLLIPFGILAAIGFALLGVVQPLGVAVLAVVALAFFLSILVVSAFVQVPVVTFLRYYALLVLGDVDPGLDLVSERREAIRVGDE